MGNERGLATVMRRPVMPHRETIHAVEAEDDTWACRASACGFVTDDLTEVARHVAERQFDVAQWQPKEAA